MPTKDTYNDRFTFEKATNMLMNYRDLVQKARQLEFEVNNYKPAASGEDMIDSMTFSRTLSERINSVHRGQTGDKTGDIAVSYSEKTARINLLLKQELIDELRLIQQDICRIEQYIDILEREYSSVLRMLYVEGLTYAETSEKAKMSISAVNNNRRKGIERLVKMLNLITY